MREREELVEIIIGSFLLRTPTVSLGMPLTRHSLQTLTESPHVIRRSHRKVRGALFS